LKSLELKHLFTTKRIRINRCSGWNHFIIILQKSVKKQKVGQAGVEPAEATL